MAVVVKCMMCSLRAVQAVRSRVIKVVQTEGMKEFLVWPDTPKRKGKRQMERQPYAINIKKIPRSV